MLTRTIFVCLFCFGISLACRSKVDNERDTILSKHGTEPPEPEHTQSKSGESKEPSESDPDDPSKHEEGDVKVGEKWEFPVAVTRKGMLWGNIEKSRSGKRILAFRGIKHVQSPVGPLRWKSPVPSHSWEGVKEAKFNGHVCPQHMYYKPDIWVGNEDCLWLNVFTRDLVVQKNRPVIVWIHGGNFVRGSAAEYEPDYILDDDNIVLVTIQYRLGMFGFLSTEDISAPGNYGMLDQVAALQWVKENIAAFSGDPNNISIMGQQAGGASVHYHLLSPLSRGLFNKAVSMSGTALSWWASIKRPLEKTKKLARLVKCPYNKYNNSDKPGELQDMMDCLRSKEMDELMNTHPNFYEWRHLQQCQEPLTSFSPRVDPESSMPFMPVEPIDLMKQGDFQHVPWIVGLTDDEGAFKVSALFHDLESLNEIEDQFEKLGPLMFGFHDGQTEAPKILAQRIREFYWGEELDLNNPKGLVDAISDSSYAHPIDTSAKIHAMKSNANVFVYHFGYRGQNSHTQLDVYNWPPKVVPKPVLFGVGNGDDLIYLFPVLSGTFRQLSLDDLVFSQQFIQLLSSFAKDGQPRVKMSDPNDENQIPEFFWHPVAQNNVTHLYIGKTMSMELGLPYDSRMSFWQQMPVYWNSDRDNYKPATPLIRKEEL